MATATKPRPTSKQSTPKRASAVSDEQVRELFSGLEPKERAKLKRCVELEIARMGYEVKSCREGGLAWEKAKRLVAVNLIQAGQTLRDVEFGEE